MQVGKTHCYLPKEIADIVKKAAAQNCRSISKEVEFALKQFYAARKKP